MQNQEILEIIENLKGRRSYEEKKASKLGFSSLYAYFEDKIYKEKKALEEEQKRAEEIKAAAADAALMEAMGEITQEESNLESLSELGFSDEEIETLVSNALKSKDDIAELAVDELLDVIEINEKKAADIIMKARESWFN